LHPRPVRVEGVGRWSGRMAVCELLERDPDQDGAFGGLGSTVEPTNRDLLRRGRWSRSPLPLATRPATTPMRRRSFNRTLLPILAILLGGSAVVPETARAQESDEIVVRVVVRHRKHPSWSSLKSDKPYGVRLGNRMTRQLVVHLRVRLISCDDCGDNAPGRRHFGDL